MYEPFFGLKESPVSLSPNRVSCLRARPSAALAQVATAALERHEPLDMIMGDDGHDIAGVRLPDVTVPVLCENSAEAGSVENRRIRRNRRRLVAPELGPI